MAGGASNDDDGLISAINVTPLVDVTLVLLIIFMVTARIIQNQGVPMDLPKAASGEAEALRQYWAGRMKSAGTGGHTATITRHLDELVAKFEALAPKVAEKVEYVVGEKKAAEKSEK